MSGIETMVEQLRALCEQQGLEILNGNNGSLMIIGGKCVVSWWPGSRKMTAYVQGAEKGVKYATPKKIIELTKGSS